jgi:hypothetical protein
MTFWRLFIFGLLRANLGSVTVENNKTEHKQQYVDPFRKKLLKDGNVSRDIVAKFVINWHESGKRSQRIAFNQASTHR